jgi:hypothetical protein
LSVSGRYMPDYIKSYDSLVYVGGGYHHHGDLWKDQWDWKRIRDLKKTPYERALLDLRIAMYNLDNRFTTLTTRKERERAIRKAQRALLPYELKEIDKIEKDLERKELLEPFNSNKKKDKWSVVYERKNKDGSRRTYISKEKRIGGKLVKEYLGKNWSDIRRKITEKATLQVWGETWAGYDLTPWQMKIFRALAQEVIDLPRKRDVKNRNPVLQKYIEQLGMTCVKAGGKHWCVLSKHMNIKDKKRILDSARKAIKKTGYIEHKEPELPKIVVVNNKRVFVHYYA